MDVTLLMTLTASDQADMAWYAFASVVPRSVLWLIGILSKLLAVVCLYLLVEVHGNILALKILVSWGFILSTAFSVKWLFLPILFRERVKRRYGKQQVVVVVHVHEEGFDVYNQDTRKRSSLTWPYVSMVVVTPNGILLCGKKGISQATPCWLPSRAFEQSHSLDDVAAYLEQIGVRTKRISRAYLL